MPVQNLVSAALTPEAKAEVLQKIADIKTKLNFLITLQPDEKKEFFKAGNTYAPFIEKAHNVIVDHPDIMSGLFRIDEFKGDYQLSKDLVPILNQVNELAESIQDTIFAVNSDAMSESLEVYSAVQMNKDKIPGLDTISAEMREFFRKTRKKTQQPVK